MEIEKTKLTMRLEITWYKMYYEYMKVKVIQSCQILCDHVDYTVHGILQTRILEWLAFPFSRGSSQPKDRIQVSLIVVYSQYQVLSKIRTEKGYVNYCLCEKHNENHSSSVYHRKENTQAEIIFRNVNPRFK